MNQECLISAVKYIVALSQIYLLLPAAGAKADIANTISRHYDEMVVGKLLAGAQTMMPDGGPVQENLIR